MERRLLYGLVALAYWLVILREVPPIFEDYRRRRRRVRIAREACCSPADSVRFYVGVDNVSEGTIENGGQVGEPSTWAPGERQEPSGRLNRLTGIAATGPRAGDDVAVVLRDRPAAGRRGAAEVLELAVHECRLSVPDRHASSSPDISKGRDGLLLRLYNQ